MTVMFVLYGVAGGLGAAIVTDFIQGLLTIVLSFLILPFALSAVGGIAGLRESVANPAMFETMGPLALTDLIGIDTVYFIASSIYEEFRDPQYAPPTLMKKMLAAGWLGRKTGKGFYEYK